jgi:hypothetical protein
MGDYIRTTRGCLVSQLRPELLQAVRDYFQEQQLGDVEAETRMCCETISKKKITDRRVSWPADKTDTTVHTGMLLTGQILLWVRSGEQSGIRLTAANLKEIQVKAYSSRLTKDTGLEISGYVRGSRGRVRGYVGMGPELAAQNFCEEVRRAIVEAKPPRKRRLPGWLRG